MKMYKLVGEDARLYHGLGRGVREPGNQSPAFLFPALVVVVDFPLFSAPLCLDGAKLFCTPQKRLPVDQRLPTDQHAELGPQSKRRN